MNEKIICVFGDSITWGACDNEMGGWVSRLRRDLEKDVKYFEIYNLGISGDNSTELVKRFSTENAMRKPSTIMIAIGINDSQYITSKNDQRVPLVDFEKNLLQVIQEGRKFTKEIIFVGLTKVDQSRVDPVPWNTDRNYTDENVALYDSKIKEICAKENLKFIEMQDVLEKTDLQDGLHPTAEGHEKMFQRIKSFLIDNKIIN